MTVDEFFKANDTQTAMRDWPPGQAVFPNKDHYKELSETPAKVDPRALVRPLSPPGRKA